MKKVMIKKKKDMGSKIIVKGKVRGEERGSYYKELKKKIMEEVMEYFEKVGEGEDMVMVEGEGYKDEINIREGDIENMGFEKNEDVKVVMVGDIERGGVIEYMVGKKKILKKEEREMVRGFIIKKFRGDI